MSGSILRQSEEVISISARELCQSSGGELLAGSPDATVTCVSTDTRDELEGCLFVALKGEHFDGGDFAEEALVRGAAGVLAERPAAQRAAAGLAAASGNNGGNGRHPLVIAVNDSSRALKDVASLVASKSVAKVVAITGSSGKTSTKDMLHSLLKNQVNTVASKASFNNEVGVPLTLLSLEPDTRVAVVEMGMQAPGEIGELVRIVTPEIAIITNIGPAHFEYAGSLENIARGKAEIARDLPPHGGLVIPYGEDLLAEHISNVAGEVITFGFDQGADVHPILHRHAEDGKLQCRLYCLGDEIDVKLDFAAHHHLLNFMAALGAYLLLGLPLAQVKTAAAEIHLPLMRGEQIELPEGITLLNDCYNANPLSMASSLDYLVSVAPGRRTVAVLGDMGELGDSAAGYHEKVGRRAAELGIDCLVGVGELAGGYIKGAREDGHCQNEYHCYHFADRSDAIGAVPGLIEPGNVVLVKASRFMKLEEISEAIIRAVGTRGSGGSGPGAGSTGGSDPSES